MEPKFTEHRSYRYQIIGPPSQLTFGFLSYFPKCSILCRHMFRPPHRRSSRGSNFSISPLLSEALTNDIFITRYFFFTQSFFFFVLIIRSNYLEICRFHEFPLPFYVVKVNALNNFFLCISLPDSFSFRGICKILSVPLQ